MANEDPLQMTPAAFVQAAHAAGFTFARNGLYLKNENEGCPLGIAAGLAGGGSQGWAEPFRLHSREYLAGVMRGFEGLEKRRDVPKEEDRGHAWGLAVAKIAFGEKKALHQELRPKAARDADRDGATGRLFD
jgi:hypothetical protein